jgi:ligand-binding sensor domain-containing protein/signal transduction histidine kinase
MSNQVAFHILSILYEMAVSFRSLRILRFVLAAACFIAAGVGVSALEPHTPLAQLGHQSWSIENGLPQNTIPLLRQTGSGYLLAGTETGLAQLDGISFRIFDHTSNPVFPDAEIRCLWSDNDQHPDANNDFWIGTANGAVWMHGEKPRRFTTQDGLPANSIRAFAQTSDHVLWVWTDAGLAHWTGERFTAVSLPANLARARITSIAAGHYGELWVGTTNGIGHWRNSGWTSNVDNRLLTNSKETVQVTANDQGDILAVTPNGLFLARASQQSGRQTPFWTTVLSKEAIPEDSIISLLYINRGGLIAVASKNTVVLTQLNGFAARVIAHYTVTKQFPGSRIQSIYGDREGSLWVGTNRGMVRISLRHSSVAVDRFPPSDPLADASVLSMLEDREGDLWIGTENAGLHILRDARFHTLSSAEGLSSDDTTAVVEDNYHALWVGTRESGLNRVSSTQNTVLTTANGLLSNVILSLAVAPDGTLWVGTPDGLNHIEPTHITTYTSADGLPDDFIQSLLADPDGTLWVGTRHGFTHFVDGHFQNWNQSSGPREDLIGAMAHSADGDLWIATMHGLTRLHHGRAHTYTTADGLSSNVITALAADKDGQLWIGTQNDGLTLWNGQKFFVVGSKDQAATSSLPNVIHTLLLDRLGYLWIASDNGLTRVGKVSLLNCAEHAVCQFDSRSLSNYTTADGLRSRETSSNSHPTAWRNAEGTVWFTTPRGVLSANPQYFPPNLGPPPITIERFAVDDHEESLFGASRIPAGHLRFQFNYAAISFSAPYKVRYQYMLEGFDHGWTDAGTRRVAYYTNIPPGSYRFLVRAAMDEADFAEQANANVTTQSDLISDASFTFTLQPQYYQTLWFRILIIAISAALILFFVRARVSRVEREFGAVMAERNRIAREIHDTLAQGYVGISLQLEVLSELLRHNKSDSAMRHLAITQELVRDGLNDARQSIWALRSQDNSESTLPVRLRRIVEQENHDSLNATFTVHGIYRPLLAATEQEILRIAQEAILNVKHHAQASRMDVRLDYDRDSIVLIITDNGKGFIIEEPSLSGTPFRAAGKAAGHFGLIGMQERATLLHGEFLIDSQAGIGTTIWLRLRVDGAAEVKNSDSVALS